MGRSASAYERELRDLLEGDAQAWRRYEALVSRRKGGDGQTVRRARFLVVRAAGSLGFDLVALRREFAFPVEVKASHFPTIHFSASSGRATQQFLAHRAAVERVGLVVLYAYRRLGRRTEEPWRLFVAPSSSRDGHLEVLRRRLPVIAQTRDGNAVLRWTDGMPLAEFLELVHFLTDRSDGVEE